MDHCRHGASPHQADICGDPLKGIAAQEKYETSLPERFADGISQGQEIAIEPIELASVSIDSADLKIPEFESELASQTFVPLLPEPAADVRFVMAPRLDRVREFNLHCIVLRMVGLDYEYRMRRICVGEHEHGGSGS